MIRKVSAALAALAFAFTSLAPAAADARDRHGGYHDGYGRRDRHWRGHDDHGDAVAAGAVGLILGLAIGSIASQPPRDQGCYDNYQRCAPPPPPPCRNPCGYDRYSGYDPRYGDPRYADQGYDPRYDDNSAYERDYGGYDGPREQCTRAERQWDRYANRYVTVDVPC